MNVDSKTPKEIKHLEVTNVFNQLKLFKLWARKRILVVDDEEFCIATMRAIFELCGFNCDYQIDFCINGKECYDKVIEAY